LDSIQKALDERKPGNKKFSSSRKEPDNITIISGILDGKTTGMPICLLVYNQDANSKDYSHLEDIFRPAHADFSWYKKFKIFDHRGGGRASGRETISRVAAGTAVEKILGDIKISAYPIQIGKFKATNFDFPPNDLLWPDAGNLSNLENYIKEIAKSGNSIGGIVEMKIINAPSGLGDPVFEKLDANLSKAIISLGAVKGIEFGKGFGFADLTGKEANDEISSDTWQSNNCGGILGGVSTGEEIILRFIVKPTPSINILQKTITKDGKNRQFSSGGRHDTIIIPRLIPAAKAMVKLVLADAISHQKLISSQELIIDDFREAFDKIDEDILLALHRRKELSKQIGKLKKKQNQQIEDKDREKKLFNALLEKSKILGLNNSMVMQIWEKIIEDSKQQQ
jgi:chorismate synthase